MNFCTRWPRVFISSSSECCFLVATLDSPCWNQTSLLLLFRLQMLWNKASSLLLMAEFLWDFFTLTQATAPPFLLLLLLPAYFGVVFLVCSWKGPQRRDNRAPARIMSPQKEMQLGPRVIQEQRWWPRFKVVRDDPQTHLRSPLTGISPLTHRHKAYIKAYTRCIQSEVGKVQDKCFFMSFLRLSLEFVGRSIHAVWLSHSSLKLGQKLCSPETKTRLFTCGF